MESRKDSKPETSGTPWVQMVGLILLIFFTFSALLAFMANSAVLLYIVEGV